MRVLKENATHLARSTRLQSKYSKASRLHKHGTNHKSLQVHENNPKSLQKQHGYKLLNTSPIMSHRSCEELGTYILVI